MLRTLSLLTLQLTLFPLLASAQTEAPSWVEYARSQHTGEPALLPNYSYAGYQFSEQPIPDTRGWLTLQVTDYGAIPDDNLFDDDGIRAAIDAAMAIDQPVVIHFPRGKYVVGVGEERNRSFEINRGHIVLRGEGADEGGTEIYTHEYPDPKLPESPRFHFRPVGAKPRHFDQTVLAKPTGEIPRGSFTLTVDSAKKLSVGQYVTLFHQSKEAIDARLDGLEWHPAWSTGKSGIRIREEHLISAIDGKRVTFKNPVQLGIPAGAGTTEIWPYAPLQEIGVEGIRFSSGWASYPQDFKHHLNHAVDYAYRGMHLTDVANSWIRDCEFDSWNVALVIDNALAVTVENVRFSGKPGHTTTYPRDSYGVLYKDIVNETPTWHALGFRWTNTASVYQNCVMLEDQSIDCHGFHPYANLFDNINGGRFTHNGGAWNAYPNGGQDFTFWNFVHNASAPQTNYDLWSIAQRKLHNYIRPYFVGFRSPGETVTFEDEGLMELKDQEAYPRSLFDAQLQLRLYGAYMSATSSAAGHPAAHANDRAPNTHWISQGDAANQWLQLDLGIEKQVSAVQIQAPWSAAAAFTVEAWIADAWQPIATAPETSLQLTLPLESPIRARKLRLVFKPGQDRDHPIAITQFQANN